MSTSGEITPVSNVYNLNYSITGSGNKSITFPVRDHFVDGDIKVNLTTAAGALSVGSATVAGTSNKTILGTAQASAPSSGGYIKVSGSGSVSVSTAGWLAQNTSETATAADVYYLLISGVKAVSGGGLTAGSGSSSLVSSGYYNGSTYDTTDNVDLSTTESSGYYKLTATGSGSVNRAAITSQVTTAGYFDADGSPITESAATSLSSNSATNAYYVKKSTLTEGTIDPSTGTRTITISSGYYPTNREITVGGTSQTTVTTSLSNTGLSTYFNAGTSSSNDVSITPLYSNSAGYVTSHTNANNGGVEYYVIKTTSVTQGTSSISGGTLTRGTASWGTGWITASSINAATFSNTSTTGTTYVDISSFAPALVTGSGLFINAGYVDNLYISLAQLVPDTPSANLASNKILLGYSALDRDGQLVTGNIQTWDGSYTID